MFENSSSLDGDFNVDCLVLKEKQTRKDNVVTARVTRQNFRRGNVSTTEEGGYKKTGKNFLVLRESGCEKERDTERGRKKC